MNKRKPIAKTKRPAAKAGLTDTNQNKPYNQINTVTKKYYFVELIITIGEYETYTNYIHSATNESEARKLIEEDCNDDNDERHTKLKSIVELSEDDFAVLSRFI